MKARQQKESVESACKILSSRTRVKILETLLDTAEGVCVKEIARQINLSHSATSHQLSRLEKYGIVDSCKNGQTNCYKVTSSPFTKKIEKTLKIYH